MAYEMSIAACRFGKYRIRGEMVEMLRQYVDRGVPLNRFLSAVVSNDFVNACCWADDDAADNLPAFASYLYNEMPSASWGSKEKIKAWLKKFPLTSATEGRNVRA